MSQVVVFLALAFSIVIALFAVQNNAPVGVRFLAYSAEGVAVSVLVLISAALGAAVMLLLGISREVSLRWRNRSVSQQLKASQARVAALEAAQAAATPVPALTPGDTTTATIPIQSDEPSTTPTA